jgi:hypothetical protein
MAIAIKLATDFMILTKNSADSLTPLNIMKNSYHVNILIPMASQIERSNHPYNKDHQSAVYEEICVSN